MNKLQMHRYAKLLARTGVNVRKGQWVVVQAQLDQPEFVEMCVEELYRAGAGKVTVEWAHQPLVAIRYKYESQTSLESFARWEIEKLEHSKTELPAMLYLESADPDGLKGVDQEKFTAVRASRSKIIKPIRDEMENRYQWCIAAVPGKAWAKKVFPGMLASTAVEKLWDAILKASRADGPDPVRAWMHHNDELAARCDRLNRLKLASLEYRSANGTDFKVGLIEGSLFKGGSEETVSGNLFNPNIPSEEIFISPKAGEAEGIVYSTKPLSYQGELIEDFSVRFEGGKVVEVQAKKNRELLEKMVSMDAGARMLGECAFIAYDSPINNTGILFYNTLFDENASCHLALGMGFNECLRGFENMTKEEIKAKGINDSMIHVDFMIGSADLDIVGVTQSGARVQIFKNGNWAI